MTRKIESKIVAYKVKSKDAAQEAPVAPVVEVPTFETMHEEMPRPEKLLGSTYKLKTPEHVSEHSLFITINDVVLNEGTDHEVRRPFEIFINSKSLEHYQWIVALTRIISAVFRKGGDVTFLVEELRSVFDPKGGYWNKGKYVPSLIAEIGNVIEQHLMEIGMLKNPEMDEHQKAFLEAKRAENASKEEVKEEEPVSTGFPPSATLCYKCHNKAVIVKDGCQTCLNCGDSKCG
ncbi:ribonucleotide-diphosphate reductase subunit alpha [Grimontia celer]|uniref:ribonucleoside-diphosphate reductase n=1 Tax=Grimontia celer TaxID=1796497 RepID=A0A128EVF5_9GAMM|nr:NrdJb [Grimontia celer]CZF78572.1 ribonucleotide-diphosphate reductase subunit alpha [Grimontia celer]